MPLLDSFAVDHTRMQAPGGPGCKNDEHPAWRRNHRV
ncbi:Uncharacterised protein [Salmonella enterica subsp. enterica]|nr:Uncharacterised protein [Salmonella enterica subsp. enterica]